MKVSHDIKQKKEKSDFSFFSLFAEPLNYLAFFLS